MSKLPGHYWELETASNILYDSQLFLSLLVIVTAHYCEAGIDIEEDQTISSRLTCIR